MKRINTPREKSFKELKLWNYRTLLMFLAISIILFLFLLLISGCKSDAEKHIWGKPFTTLPIPKMINVVPTQTTAELEGGKLLCYQETLVTEIDIEIIIITPNSKINYIYESSEVNLRTL